MAIFISFFLNFIRHIEKCLCEEGSYDFKGLNNPTI